MHYMRRLMQFLHPQEGDNKTEGRKEPGKRGAIKGVGDLGGTQERGESAASK